MPCFLLDGRERRFNYNDVCQWMGIAPEQDGDGVSDQNIGKTVVGLVARVSSPKHKQSGDLDRQAERVREYILAQYPGCDILEYVGTGSGLNFNRVELLRLIDDMMSRKLNIVVAEHFDRLARYSTELIARLAEHFGVKIVYINPRDDETESLVDDITSLLSCYNGKIYGGRSAKRMRRKIPAALVKEGMERLRAGQSQNQIVQSWLAREVKDELGRGMKTTTLFRMLRSILISGALDMPEEIADNLPIQHWKNRRGSGKRIITKKRRRSVK